MTLKLYFLYFRIGSIRSSLHAFRDCAFVAGAAAAIYGKSSLGVLAGQAEGRPVDPNKGGPADPNIRNPVKRGLADTYNVIGYGAVGDGVTDDTAAIQACIEDVPEEGGQVYFPSGVYVVSITHGDSIDRIALKIRKNIRFIGAGEETTIIKLAANQGDYKAIISHSSSYNVEGFYMEHMTIDQNNRENQLTSHDGLMAAPFWSRY